MEPGPPHPRTRAADRADSPGDERLLERARSGDQTAFRSLVERYEGIVAATVIGMLGPGADADDVGQEVFVRFYRAIDRFRGDAALATYLTRIAINLSLNAIKRRNRWRTRFLSRDRGAEETPLPEPGVDGDKVVATRDLARVVDAALARLPPEQRSVAVLRLVRGHSTREVSELLGIPEGTVTSRLTRARRTLQVLLRPYVEDDDD